MISIYMPDKRVCIGQSIYRWGGPVPAVRFKSPGKGGLGGLADVLDPPQNVGQVSSCVECRVGSMGPLIWQILCDWRCRGETRRLIKHATKS
jgi:hypothetical protein